MGSVLAPAGRPTVLASTPMELSIEATAPVCFQIVHVVDDMDIGLLAGPDFLVPGGVAVMRDVGLGVGELPWSSTWMS